MYPPEENQDIQECNFQRSRKVLIVDDDVDVRAIVKSMVQCCGNEAETASSGREAVEMMTQNHFDIVLLDIILGDSDGVDLIPEFREINPEILIVTMTGNNPRETEARARKQRVAYHLVKPFGFWELKTIFKHVAKIKSGETEEKSNQ
ncbi:response regulator [Thermodesulfobacteriota bacterium]